MVGQVMLAANASPQNLTNVVFMGMGEPFDNYDAVLKAVIGIYDTVVFFINPRLRQIVSIPSAPALT